jgi:hypothetical protein
VTEPWAWDVDPISLRDRLVDPARARRWLDAADSHDLPWARVAVLRLLDRLDEAADEATSDLRTRRSDGVSVAGALVRLATVRQWQGRHDDAVALLVQALEAGGSRSERAHAWQHLGKVLAETGRRAQGLVATRTALAMREAADAPVDQLESSRLAVRALTGPDVVPLHVAVGASDHGGRVSADEARAVWVGAPGHRVLAMMGWVERDGCLDVVRVVVPGTRRGRAAFRLLLAAVPDVVPVGLRLPARDGDVRRTCERAGFVEDAGSEDSGGHVGGSIRLHRDPRPLRVPAPRRPMARSPLGWLSRR